MNKAITVACCFVSGLGASQVECISQQKALNLVRVAYESTFKDLPVQSLNKELNLENAIGIRISNLNEKDTELAMQEISVSKKLRTLVVEKCHLNSQFPQLFDKIRQNNSELTTVKVLDSKKTLTKRDSFMLWISLSRSENLREWHMHLPALTTIQNKTANQYLKSIGMLNVYIKAANTTYTKMIQDYTMTGIQLMNYLQQCEACEQKLLSSDLTSGQYKSALNEYVELRKQSNEIKEKHEGYLIGVSNWSSNITQIRYYRDEAILAMQSLESMTEKYLEEITKDYPNTDWDQAIRYLSGHFKKVSQYEDNLQFVVLH